MPADLLTHPRWHADHLGLPMPDDRHAVSACLPTWQHCIGYEEGDPSVHQQLQAAYPRFCIHPDVQALCEQLFPAAAGLPFVTERAARRAVAYVQHAGGHSAALRSIPGQPCVGVSVQPDEFPLLRQYWQHSGEIVSSRVAERILNQQQVHCSDTPDRQLVRSRIAALHRVPPRNVYLYTSGMAAIAAAWRAVQTLFPQRPTCQFGFPYVDTLKIQERFPGSSHRFLPQGSPADLDQLEQLLAQQPFGAVFCETPTNPLLMTPDLTRLSQLTQQSGSLLIVDDTLRACHPRSVLSWCDLVTTSLTKYFSGYGNLLAGALILSPGSAQSEQLGRILGDDYEETLSNTDVTVLRRNSEDLEERVAACTSAAGELVQRLRQHPAVDRVYYSDDDDPRARGALFSLVLRNSEGVTPAVFDRLQLCKGPNLGTRFTLCCPYTILAHYDELDFAESCGASRWLLRFSVGLEPVEELWNRFQEAFAAC